MTSSTPRWSGSTGSTTVGFWSPSATYHRSSSRVSTGSSRPRTIQSDPRNRVSTEPGAIHCCCESALDAACCPIWCPIWCPIARAAHLSRNGQADLRKEAVTCCLARMGRARMLAIHSPIGGGTALPNASGMAGARPGNCADCAKMTPRGLSVLDRTARRMVAQGVGGPGLCG